MSTTTEETTTETAPAITLADLWAPDLRDIADELAELAPDAGTLLGEDTNFAGTAEQVNKLADLVDEYQVELARIAAEEAAAAAREAARVEAEIKAVATAIGGIGARKKAIKLLAAFTVTPKVNFAN